MQKRTLILASAVLALSAAAALARPWMEDAPATAGAPVAPPPHPTVAYRASVPPAQRRAFFGELHLHTIMSFDAWTFGTKVTPDMAYKFGRGETVMVPAAQMARLWGKPVTADVPARRAWPLDFMAVTDHSEYLGAFTQLDDPNSAFSQSDLGKMLHGQTGQRAFYAAAAALLGDGGDVHGGNANVAVLKAAQAAANGWNVEMKAANDNYLPGKFTTLIGYEWTASPGNGIHMHRNVIFNTDLAPMPFTAVDSNKPEDLWKYLDSVRAGGIEVLAIPHNSNLSDGRDYDWNMSDGKPIDAAYAVERALNEPLAEIVQTKGSSDTAPELSPNDEFANFEIMDRLYNGETKTTVHGGFVREAFGRGLVIQSRVGVNPFRMGIVGGSDIHNGLTVSDESGAFGRNGLDPKTMLPTGDAAKFALDMTGKPLVVRPNGQTENDPIQAGSAGLTGVWAEENTRGAIFAALKRKETFGTSGSRVRVRMFGGWGFDPKFLAKGDWVARAYAQGVAMGGDLPARPQGAAAPAFVLQAMKDPDGANLDRIQIIKLWLDGDGYKEKIFNVALSGKRRVDASGLAPAVGNTVDLKTGGYRNSIGAATLAAVWRDPEFDPTKPAVYYARVLEIPTPRWSTLLAIKNNLPLSPKAPATIQERAWTSPIWFSPS